MSSNPDQITQRKIVHVDMDAFYASVEQRDDPSLKGRAIVVGGDSARGVVAAASYEARQFGIRSAMPMRMAMEKCRDLVVVKPRFDVYRGVSRQIREVFAEHTPLIEPLSLDEAYLDVTTNLQELPTATAVAEAIRAEILKRTGLTASAGVSANKFLAKLGSGLNKPNGLTVIRPERGADVVADLPVSRFHGIGPATAAKMAQLGIHTGRDLREQSIEHLTRFFGRSAVYYKNIAWGLDDRPVVPDRERKSYGSENTFETDLSRREDIVRELDDILERVWEDRTRIKRDGRTVTLKAKYRDFEQITRSRSASALVSDRDEIKAVVLSLLDSIMPLSKPLRLVGVSISNLGGVDEVAPAARQMALL
jgi:DNA polymerase-4